MQFKIKLLHRIFWDLSFVLKTKRTIQFFSFCLFLLLIYFVAQADKALITSSAGLEKYVTVNVYIYFFTLVVGIYLSRKFLKDLGGIFLAIPISFVRMNLLMFVFVVFLGLVKFFVSFFDISPYAIDQMVKIKIQYLYPFMTIQLIAFFLILRSKKSLF